MNVRLRTSNNMQNFSIFNSLLLFLFFQITFGFSDNSTEYHDIEEDSFFCEIYKVEIKNQWELVQVNAQQPHGRSGHSSVYFDDGIERYMIIFGGIRSGGTYISDLWKFSISNSIWIPLVSYTPSPEPRSGHTAILLEYNLYIFGGHQASIYYNDLWLFSLSNFTWQQIFPNSAPFPRSGHSIISLNSDQFLIFGGTNGNNFFNDMWSYSILNNSWTQITLNSSLPQARARHSLLNYNGQGILFGGVGANQIVFNDMWQLNLSNVHAGWTFIPTSANAPSSFGHSAIIREPLMYIIDGQPDVSDFSDVISIYNLNFKNWNFISPVVRPLPRSGLVGITFDKYLLIFGGIGYGQVFADMWTFDCDLIFWASLKPLPEAPLALIGHSANYVNGTMYVFGGRNPNGRQNDMWVFNLDRKIWTLVQTLISPAPRLQHSMVVYKQSLILFGGSGIEQLNDLWEFHIYEGCWTPLFPNNFNISSRYRHSAVALNEKMYVFGGSGIGNLVYGDFYYFSFSNSTWNEITTDTSPGRRRSSSMVVLNGLIYLFGGTNNFEYFDDMWVYDPSNNTWIQLSSNLPSQMSSFSLVATPSSYLLMFGGYNSQDLFLGDLWLFHFEQNIWINLNSSYSRSSFFPYPLSDQTAVVTDCQTMLLMGGQNMYGYSDKLWTYYIPSIPQVPIEINTTWNSISDILISWNPPLDTGGLPILRYELLFFKGSSNELSHSENVTTSFYYHNSKAFLPASYTCKIRCENILGWSLFTSISLDDNPILFLIGIGGIVIFTLFLFCFFVAICNVSLYAKKNRDVSEFSKTSKSLLKAYLLWIFLGLFGVHRFYLFGLKPPFFDWRRSGSLMLVFFWSPISWFLWVMDGFMLPSLIDSLFIDYESTVPLLSEQVRTPLSDLNELTIHFNDLEMKNSVKLGQGTFGTSMKATWKNQPVVVKQIHSILLEDWETNIEWKNKFFEKLKEISSLKHPNIVLLLGISLDPLAIVTEFVNNGSVYNILRQKPGSGNLLLTSENKLQLIREISKGMSYLHSRDIVHGNLKSQNVLCDKQFHVKISDIGIGLLFDSKNSGNQFENNISWAAPEVLRFLQFSEKVDVYSFAIILWEFLTYSDPYQGMFSTQIIIEVVQGFRPRIPDSTSLEFKNLITASWQQEPTNRPSFEQINLELEKITTLERKEN